jgi:hypothetical protein
VCGKRSVVDIGKHGTRACEHGLIAKDRPKVVGGGFGWTDRLELSSRAASAASPRASVTDASTFRGLEGEHAHAHDMELAHGKPIRDAR